MNSETTAAITANNTQTVLLDSDLDLDLDLELELDFASAEQHLQLQQELQQQQHPQQILEMSTHVYDPHSNRGRRQQTEPSADRRTQQMREAQRALRARKQNYVRSLEEKVALLTRRLNSGNVLHSNFNNNNQYQYPCPNPSCATQIAALTALVSQLNNTLAAVSLAHATTVNNTAPTVNTFLNSIVPANIPDDNLSFDWLWDSDTTNTTTFATTSNSASSQNIASSPVSIGSKSSQPQAARIPSIDKCPQDVYGPIEIEPYRTETKSLPSLIDSSKVVDRIFDLVGKQSLTADIKDSRNLLLKMIRESIRMQERCSIPDRVKLTEIMAKFQMKNSKQLEHHRLICAQPLLSKNGSDLHNHGNSASGSGLDGEYLFGFNDLGNGTDEHIITGAHESNKATKATAADIVKVDVDPRILPHRLQIFRNTLQAIPSLKNFHNDIEIFLQLWMDGDQFDADSFFVFHLRMFNLLSKCEVLEDKIKFWVAFEILRNSKSKDMDELLA
ncbi:hypothetical protein HK100_003715, partial [Physocladia obscura]